MNAHIYNIVYNMRVYVGTFYKKHYEIQKKLTFCKD